MAYIITCSHHVALKDCPHPDCQQIHKLTEQLAAERKRLDFFLNWQHATGEQDDDETGHTFYLMDNKAEYHGKTWREAIDEAMK